MLDLKPKQNVIWEPFPGTSQEFAVDTRAHHTLYHGTRGPGKTVCQLFNYRKEVGIGYGPFWRGIIFDREFKNLSDLVAQSRRFFPQFNDGCRFLSSASDYKWMWPTGEELLFRHIKRLSDYDQFHGHEYPFIGWNELTKQPTSELYDKMMSTNRSSFDPMSNTATAQVDGRQVFISPDGNPLPPIPLRIFSTTNPNGPGHHWVKKRFISCAPSGKLLKQTIRLFNPQTQQEEDITKTQIAIFGSYKENKLLSPEYIFELENEKNPNLRAAWLYGDWNISSGNAIGDLWQHEVHVIERFPIPVSWNVNRCFDWGSSHPYAIGWFAEANGEEVTKDFCPTKGSLIMFSEIYGALEIGKNQGLRKSAVEIAEEIKEHEINLLKQKWIKTQPVPGPTDTQIYNVHESDVDTIGKKMEDHGIRWINADKSAGSRINGLELLRNRLESSLTGEGPAIYFMRNCSATIEILPVLPLDENNIEDVDTDSEDHMYDVVRYRVLQSNNRYATKLNVKYPQ